MQTLGLGFTWEQLSPGQRFRTLNRTVTETDLVLFTGVTGMLESIFFAVEVQNEKRRSSAFHRPGPDQRGKGQRRLRHEYDAGRHHSIGTFRRAKLGIGLRSLGEFAEDVLL